MINKFPQFTELELQHRSTVELITTKFEVYSDFNFTSLFCWGTDDETKIAILNGNLIIQLPDYQDGHSVFSMLGISKVDESIKTLMDTFERMTLVPEIVIDNIRQKSKYIISEDRDNFDYIYDLADLSKLSGYRYKKLRNKKNAFLKAHENRDLKISTLTELGASSLDSFRSIMDLWAKESGKSEADITSEQTALFKLLKNQNELELIFTELYVDGQLVAFSINEVIGSKNAICHFEKALKSHHEYIYPFLIHEVAKNMLAAGCKWMNWEQDLGLEGLRKSKLSYRPVRMLKKYTISLKK